MGRGFTVKDIAERVCRTDEARLKLIERIRYWTRNGWLVPLGEKHTGTGRARTYSAEKAYLAAVLNELTKYQTPPSLVEGIAQAFRLCLRIANEDDYKNFNLPDEFLDTSNGATSFELHHGKKKGCKYKKKTDKDSVIEIMEALVDNAICQSAGVFLTLYAQTDPGISTWSLSLDKVVTPKSETSGIILNLTNVFAQVQREYDVDIWLDEKVIPSLRQRGKKVNE